MRLTNLLLGLTVGGKINANKGRRKHFQTLNVKIDAHDKGYKHYLQDSLNLDEQSLPNSPFNLLKNVGSSNIGLKIS